VLYSLLLSGEIVVAVVFFEALGISLILLGFPLWVISRRKRKPFAFSILYFLSVGAGFMFTELYFIKAYTEVFGDPIISFTIVLSGILMSSGTGGFWSQRLNTHHIRYGLIAVVVLMGLGFFGMDLVLDAFLKLSIPFNYVFAFLFLFPFGFLLGLPFPLGMRYLFDSPEHRAYGWALNGCASVLTSIASEQIALSFGISHILVCGVAACFLSFIFAESTYKVC
jgi:hypothetical protein